MGMLQRFIKTSKMFSSKSFSSLVFVYAFFTIIHPSLQRDCLFYGADIVFLVDGSQSIDLSTFEDMKKMILEVIKTSDVGTNYHQNKFALVQFSEDIKTLFSFKNRQKAEYIISTLKNMKKLNQTTNTEAALNKVLDLSFYEGTKMESNKVIFFLGDGSILEHKKVDEFSQKFKEKNFLVVTAKFGTPKDSYLLSKLPTSSYLCLNSTFFDFPSLLLQLNGPCKSPNNSSDDLGPDTIIDASHTENSEKEENGKIKNSKPESIWTVWA